MYVYARGQVFRVASFDGRSTLRLPKKAVIILSQGSTVTSGVTADYSPTASLTPEANTNQDILLDAVIQSAMSGDSGLQSGLDGGFIFEATMPSEGVVFVAFELLSRVNLIEGEATLDGSVSLIGDIHGDLSGDSVVSASLAMMGSIQALLSSASISTTNALITGDLKAAMVNEATFDSQVGLILPLGLALQGETTFDGGMEVTRPLSSGIQGASDLVSSMVILAGMSTSLLPQGLMNALATLNSVVDSTLNPDALIQSEVTASYQVRSLQEVVSSMVTGASLEAIVTTELEADAEISVWATVLRLALASLEASSTFSVDMEALKSLDNTIEAASSLSGEVLLILGLSSGVSGDADLGLNTSATYGANILLSPSANSSQDIIRVLGASSDLYGVSSLTGSISLSRDISSALSASSSMTPAMDVISGMPIPASGLVAWFDADSPYMNSTYSNGSSVSTMDDLSGNGYDFTSRTLGDQEVRWSSSGYIYYQVSSTGRGVSGTYLNNIYSDGAIAEYTVFHVGRVMVSTVNMSPGATVSTSNSFTIGVRISLSHSHYRYANNSTLASSFTSFNNAFYIESSSSQIYTSKELFTWEADATANTRKYWKNSTLRSTGTYSASGTLADLNLRFYAQQAYNYEVPKGTSWSGNTQLYELIIYDRPLTTEEREAVETYLSTRHGL